MTGSEISKNLDFANNSGVFYGIIGFVIGKTTDADKGNDKWAN